VLRSWSPSWAPGEDGRLRDSAMYSVIASEWPSCEDHLSNRLVRFAGDIEGTTSPRGMDREVPVGRRHPRKRVLCRSSVRLSSRLTLFRVGRSAVDGRLDEARFCQRVKSKRGPDVSATQDGSDDHDVVRPHHAASMCAIRVSANAYMLTLLRLVLYPASATDTRFATGGPRSGR
jgi:hypothetical protein